MITPHLREVTATDSPLLTALHAEGFAHYWDTSAFNDFFSVTGTVAIVAEIDGTPVGMMVYRVVHEQADIITIVVRPAQRRHGLAQCLLQYALLASMAKGATQMFLDVEDGNIPAIQLYEKNGFSLINRRKLYYRQKDGSYKDALVMSRVLG